VPCRIGSAGCPVERGKRRRERSDRGTRVEQGTLAD
jgi:hypothetical protein